jgi:hypothetical protein
MSASREYVLLVGVAFPEAHTVRKQEAHTDRIAHATTTSSLSDKRFRGSWVVGNLKTFMCCMLQEVAGGLLTSYAVRLLPPVVVAHYGTIQRLCDTITTSH